MHYVDEGKGPVVLLLHGNPTWSFYYRSLIHTLRLSHRVIAVDHLGCGLSDKPQDYQYTLKNHTDNLEKFVKERKLDQFSIVMHDWGGAIGFGLIQRMPEKIAKIVVHNTAAFPSRRIPLRIAFCKIPGLGKVIVRGLNGFAGAAVHMAVEQEMTEETKSWYLKPYDSWKNRIAVHEFVKDIPFFSNHRSYQALLVAESGIAEVVKRKIPALVLWGGKDFCFTKHFYNEWLRRIPYCQHHYFENYGHYLLEDEKGEVVKRVRKFFTDEI